MKMSNLILTFVLALITSCLCAQSNDIREITVNNDEGSFYIKYENDEVSELQVDGKTIHPRDYSEYHDIISMFSNDSRVPAISTRPTPPTPPSLENEDNAKTELRHQLTQYLAEVASLNTNRYNLKLTSKYVKLNGKKLDKDIWIKCTNIFQSIYGHPLSSGSYFKAKVSRNSTSISLNIKD